MKFRVVPASLALLMVGNMAALAQAADSRFEDAPDQSAAMERFLERTFDRIDQNQDSTVDRAEWAVFMTAWLSEQRQRFDRRFSAADTNRDGYLDRTEAERNEPILALRFGEIDSTGDDLLSAREIRQAIRRKQVDE